MRKHFDLFSGIGGFKLAAQWAGFETVGFSEVEPYACKLLAQHWSHIKNYGDIKKINGKDIIEEHGAIELITGGPPCQPVSVAGQRKGADDDRWLWGETIELVDCIRPRCCLFENPTGIISMGLDDVLSKMEGIGYTTRTIIIPASALYAWHRRDRCWIIAYLNDDRTRKSRNLHCSKRSGSGNQEQFNSRTENAANSYRGRVSKRVAGQAGESQGDPGRSYYKITERYGQENGSGVEWWATEPPVGRMVHGIPNRSLRIKGLGNAIVPQVAYEILRLMN